MEKVYIKETLRQYLTPMTPEIYQWMNLILLEDIYKLYNNPGKYLKPDGNGRE